MELLVQGRNNHIKGRVGGEKIMKKKGKNISSAQKTTGTTKMGEARVKQTKVRTKKGSGPGLLTHRERK